MIISYKPTTLGPMQSKMLTVSAEKRFWNKFSCILKASARFTQYSTPINLKKKLLLYSSSKEVFLYDLRKRSLRNKIRKERGHITSLALRNDAGLLAWGNDSGSVKVFAVKQRVLLKEVVYSDNSKPVRTVDFAPNHKSWLGIGDDNSCVGVYDFATQQHIFKVDKAHGDFPRSVKFAGDNDEMLISGGLDKCVKVWDRRADPKKPAAVIHYGFEVEGLALDETCRQNLG